MKCGQCLLNQLEWDERKAIAKATGVATTLSTESAAAETATTAGATATSAPVANSDEKTMSTLVPSIPRPTTVRAATHYCTGSDWARMMFRQRPTEWDGNTVYYTTHVDGTPKYLTLYPDDGGTVRDIYVCASYFCGDCWYQSDENSHTRVDSAIARHTHGGYHHVVTSLEYMKSCEAATGRPYH